MLERAIDFVVCWQRPGGELVWSRGPRRHAGRLRPVDRVVLGLLQPALRHRLRRRARPGAPDWELAAGRLSHAIAHGSEGFADKDEFAMDWYYPVLVGALAPAEASRRIERRWDEFVDRGAGRALRARPAVGDRGRDGRVRHRAVRRSGGASEAASLLAWAGEHRWADGSYMTGLVHPERSSFPPGERSSYTAAAVVLAEDALSGASPAAQLFADGSLPTGSTSAGPRCPPSA